MEHVMEQINAVGMVPISKSEPKHHSIHQAAVAIFNEWGNVNNNPTRVILALVAEGMSCQEYDQAEQQAIKMAENADALSGWTPAANAQGIEKYGPKKRTMSVQASQRRQVFGAAKMCLSAIVSIPDSGIVNPDTFPTFTEAVKRARKWLGEQGLTWDGRSVSDVKKAAEHNADFKAQYKAEEQARKTTMKEQGETYQEWEARCKTIAKDILQEQVDKQRQAQVDKIAQALFAKHGAELSADIGAALLKLAGFVEEESPL